MIGLLGLVTGGGGHSGAISELAEKLERFEAGESDVDFSSERDDELGRLYDAIDEVVETVRTRDQRAQESEHYRRELYRITSDPTSSGEEKIQRLLELGCERFGVENGLIAQIDEGTGRYNVRMVSGSDFVQVGDASLSETFCRKTITSDDIIGIYNAAEEGFEDDPGYQEWGIGCYLGGRIEVAGDLYGTLCFVDPEPRTEPFTQAERTFADLLTRWVSYELERRESDRVRRISERAMEAAPVGVTITDPTQEDNPIVSANEEFERITGYDEAATVGRNCRFLQGEGTDSEPVETMREAIDAAEQTTVELRNYRRDDTPFWNRVSIAPVEDETGDVTHFVGFQEDVTERVAREHELERYRAYTDDLLDAIDDVFYVLDTDGSLQRWNESLPETTGYTNEEVGSMHALEFFAEEEQELVADALEKVHETGTFRIDVPLRTDGGESIPYEFVASRLEDPNGNPIVVGIGRDVSERTRYERELEQTTELLEQAQRIASVGGWTLDVSEEPNELTLTDESYRQLGISSETELDVDELLEFYHPDDRRRLVAAAAAALADGESYDLEARLRTADGNRRWVRTIGEPVLEDGDVVAVRGSMQDITERTMRERRLRERERQYSTLISNIPGMVYRCRNEPDWPFEFVSEGVREITGYEPEALESGDVNWDEDLILERNEELWDQVQRCVDEREPFHVTYPIETAGGDRRWVREQGRGVFAEDGTLEALEGVIIDVTERVENERELERTTALLEQVQSMAQVGGWELDLRADHREVTWTEELYRLHELPRDTTLDQDTIVECYHPDDRRRVRRRLETALETETSYDLEGRLLTESGTTRWVRATGEPIHDDGDLVGFRGSVQDITEQKEREHELERTTALLEQTQRIAHVGGWELDLRGDPPYEGTLTDELHRLHEVPLDEEFDLEYGLEFYHPEDRDRVREAVEHAIAEGESYDAEARLITATGTQRWVQTTGVPVVDEETGEVLVIRGALQDITERKERELALGSLHEAARGLLHAETDRSVAEVVVETADEILDIAGASISLLDSTTNRLEPVAFSDAIVDGDGRPPSVAVGDGDSVLWNVFATGSQTVVDDSVDELALHDGTNGGGLVVPIGTHGVFVAIAPTPTIDDETRRLVETLVATAEAAFDRLESEASLRERDVELEAQNRRLRRQIQVTEIIRTIDQSLIGSASREEIERTVCERLVEEAGIEFAWIGATDVSGETLVPRTWAGSKQEYLDTISLDHHDGPSEPAVTTAQTETATVVPNVVEGLKDEPWRTHALTTDFHSVVSVPLSFDQYSYGVLSVYANEPDTFGDLERSVFEELGESIANAINTVTTRQALHADSVFELTLGFSGSEDLLERLAREVGCHVEFEGLPTHATEETRLFFTTSGGDPATIEAALERFVSVTEHRLVRESDAECLYEATVSGPVLASRLVRHGANPRSIHASEDGVTVVVDVPTATDVREFVEMLADRYPTIELHSRRTVSRATHTSTQLAATLFEELTDRQLEVLKTAYFAGYFDWPRESTGEEVAEMLGVSQPAINRHLRVGQRRLLEQLLDTEAQLAVGES